jgi:hypothetical protein
MRKLLTFFYALIGLLSALPAFAQMPMTGAGLGAPAAGGSPPVWTETAVGNNNACGFSNPCAVAGLTTNAGTVVVIVGGSNQGTAAITTGVQVCTTSLTKATDNGDTANNTSIWYGTLVSGGTCTVTVTGGSGTSFFSIGVGVGTLTNLTSTTPTSTCSGDYVASQNSPYPCTSSVTVPASGFAIIGGYEDAVTSLGVSGSTFTLDAQTNASTVSAMIGHNSSAGSVTPSFTGGNFQHAGIVTATWH